MFLSLFKKKDAPAPAPSLPSVVKINPVVQVKVEEEVKGKNLPCWKDKSVWFESMKIEPSVELKCRELQYTIIDLLRVIKDPEKPNSLEDLDVITEDSVQVQPLVDEEGYLVRIDFNPTVPHCSLASLIGLCLRNKIQNNVLERVKLDIVIAEGKHSTEEEINKQINDKERVAAAMENPNLRGIVESCVKDVE